MLLRWLRRGERPRQTPRRQQQLEAWNNKLLGALLARQRFAEGKAGPGLPAPPAPLRVGLQSGLCRQRDMEAPWMHHWCGQIRIAPLYHRKLWEDGFVLQALWEAGILEPGRQALGFAVGQEPLPAYLAARGLQVLATDLDAGDPRANVWTATQQHAEAGLFRPQLIARPDFDARVATRAVDMNAIPADLHGRFDLVWSVCALEHLGSIEAGLRFIEESVRCLKPGGIAVHTTEFDLDAQGPVLDHATTVLFQRPHIEALARRLEAAGHAMAPVDFSPGEDLLDGFIDQPPYPGQDCWPLAFPQETPHLRLLTAGRVATSIGLIIRAGSAPG